MSKSYVQDLETGRWKPREKTLKKLSDALGYNFVDKSYVHHRVYRSLANEPQVVRKRTMKTQAKSVNQFADMLRKNRIAQGLTVQRLAEIVGCCRQTVSQWEGGGSVPQIDAMKVLAEMFNFNPDHYNLEEVRKEYASRLGIPWKERFPAPKSQWDNIVGKETPNNITLARGQA